MSVLQRKHSVSKMEYVYNAYDIERQSLDFIKRLSVKNARLYHCQFYNMVLVQADDADIANEIYVTKLNINFN